MLLILDADQLARQTDNWEAVVVRAQQWGASPAVGLVLSRAHAFLNTPLPADLHRQLGVSNGLRLFTRAIDKVSPVPALLTEASLARLSARSVRPSSIQTLATFCRRATQGAASRLGRQRTPVPWEERAPANADALETYLRAVEREAGRSGERPGGVGRRLSN